MIYQPAEDSYLLSEILRERLSSMLKAKPNLKFLEIGAGSGMHLQTAKSKGIKKENIFSVDIDKQSVEHCKSLGFNCIKSDLFNEIIIQKFDLIIFNPPYLPDDKDEPKDSKLATTGGKNGNEIILRFLKQSKNYISKDGLIFLVKSSLSPKINFEKLGYSSEEIGCEKLFFEQLCVYELKLI